MVFSLLLWLELLEETKKSFDTESQGMAKVAETGK
jgi:hypothetical protein